MHFILHEATAVSLYEKQEQLRANLNALQPGSHEAALRNRMLGQLEFTQDRLEAIDRESDGLVEQMEDGEARANNLIAGLGGTRSNPIQRFDSIHSISDFWSPATYKH